MEIATLELTAYQAVAVAAIVLLLGRFLCSKIGFLNTYCIPAPVVGGPWCWGPWLWAAWCSQSLT